MEFSDWQKTPNPKFVKAATSMEKSISEHFEKSKKIHKESFTKSSVELIFCEGSKNVVSRHSVGRTVIGYEIWQNHLLTTILLDVTLLNVVYVGLNRNIKTVLAKMYKIFQLTANKWNSMIDKKPHYPAFDKTSM